MWSVLKRLSLGVLLIGLASAVLLLSDTQRQRGTRQAVRVAMLQHASQPALDEGARGMLDGLAEQGFVDGRTLALRRYNAENDLPTANAIAKEMVSGDYDLLLTISTLSLQNVANANRAGTVKHVFALVTDPFGAGVGISREHPLEHPRYMAGFGTMQPVAEAFALARRLFPGLTTVGEVWNAGESNAEAQTKLARAACRELGVELIEANVENSLGVQEAAASLVARGAQAIWVPGDVTVLTAIDTIIAVARTAGIPVFTSIPGNVDRGALFDLGADYHEVGRLAGVMAGQILNGRDPATIPIENVLPQTLRINRAALAGLSDPWRIPDDVLRSAEVAGEARAASANAPLGKTWRIDLLEYINVLDVEDGEKGIRAGLQAAGLVDGRDYVIRVRNAQGDMPTLPALVDAALSDGTDLLMTLSTPTLQAALQRARSVPLVFTFVADAVVAGAGRSNDDHLPHVTGVPTASAHAELVGVVRECLPAARRIGTLFVPAEVNSVVNKDMLTKAAAAAGIEVLAVAANTSAEMSDAAAALCGESIDAVVQVGGNLTTAAFASLTQAAQRARVPLFGALSSNAHDGAAVTVTRDYFDGGRDAGLMAARIMRGESPATIPFQPLTKTRIIVNRDGARAAGMTIPDALLRRAEVIGG